MYYLPIKYAKRPARRKFKTQRPSSGPAKENCRRRSKARHNRAADENSGLSHPSVKAGLENFLLLYC